MAKKTFFFSHDANARNDEKILALRMRHHMEGYGIYFAIIEKLLESTDYMLLKDYNTIAFELRASAEIVKSVIEEFGLFEFTQCGKLFYSKSLIGRMDALEEKREKRSEAGKKGAQKRWSKAEKIANDTQSNSNAITKPPEKIAEESKVKKSKITIYLSNAREDRLVFESLVPLMEELMNDECCIEEFRRTAGTPYPNTETVCDKLKEFFVKLTIDGQDHKERKDAIYHFKSWYRQQAEIDRTKKKKGVNNAIQNTRYNRKPANKTGMAGIKD